MRYVRPAVHGANDPRTGIPRYRLEFDWVGTTDPTAALALPAAIDWMGAQDPGGWPAVMAANHALAVRARDLLAAAVAHQARIDQLTQKALVARWPIDRIDPTLRALFRAAGAELVATDTPPKVTITEYLEVAKAFYPDGKETKFVNGVLDHMARAARPEAFG